MKLNIYKKKEVVKTYEADTYDLMFGTLEDIAESVNLDDLTTGTNAEIIKLAAGAVVNNLENIKNLLKDIFDGLTDDELKHVKVNEIIEVISEVILYTISQLKLGTNAKNLIRDK